MMGTQNLSVATRELPKSIETEQAVLGALLINNAILERIGEFLESRHFSEDIHQRIYETASALIRAGKVASPVALKAYLGDEDLGGLTVGAYLGRLVAEAPGVLIAVDYARNIVDLYSLRTIISVGRKMIDDAHELPVGVKPSEIATTFIGSIQAIVEGVGENNTRRDAGKSAADLLNQIAKIRSGEIERAGVSTGFPEIDRDTGGFMPGNLWVVGARPGMGKTVLSCHGALNAARAGYGATLFSLEVPEEQVNARLLSEMTYTSRFPIQFGRILRGDIDDLEQRRLEGAQKALLDMPLVLDVAPRLSVTEISLRVKAEKRRMAKQGVRLGVVFIDYLKFVKASDRYKGQRVYEVGEISAGLKELAKSEDVCVVLLAQLNRALENREDKRPGLSDLRESGDLEADADVVAFLHRESYFIQASADSKPATSPH